MKTCREKNENEKGCANERFALATALVFNNMDVTEGLDIFKSNAVDNQHPDSMTAVGVVLVEGLGCDEDPKEGSDWLVMASSLDHSQADYELACLFYAGSAAPYIEENLDVAKSFFEKSAAKKHICGSYMLADVLVEDLHKKETKDEIFNDTAAAIDLFVFAADNGHRFSRQQVIMILEGRHPLVKIN